MRLLEVNGVSLLGSTHQDAVQCLRTAGNEIHLVVCKGYDKSSLIHSIGSAGGMSTGFGSQGSRQGKTFRYFILGVILIVFFKLKVQELPRLVLN